MLRMLHKPVLMLFVVIMTITKNACPWSRLGHDHQDSDGAASNDVEQQHTQQHEEEDGGGPSATA